MLVFHSKKQWIQILCPWFRSKLHLSWNQWTKSLYSSRQNKIIIRSKSKRVNIKGIVLENQKTRLRRRWRDWEVDEGVRWWRRSRKQFVVDVEDGEKCLTDGEKHHGRQQISWDYLDFIQQITVTLQFMVDNKLTTNSHIIKQNSIEYLIFASMV